MDIISISFIPCPSVRVRSFFAHESHNLIIPSIPQYLVSPFTTPTYKLTPFMAAVHCSRTLVSSSTSCGG